jgi:hypothetical protein
MADNVIKTKNKDELIAAGRGITDGALLALAIQDVENLSLLPVGKPNSFHPSIDPNQRVHHYLESKMSIIDVIPCNYIFPLTKAGEILNENTQDSSVILDSMLPKISYGQAVTEFGKVCKHYGLPGSYGGIRLYLTDETTSTDEFSNTYTNNWLQDAFNALTDKGRKFREVARSVSSAYDSAIAKGIGDAGGAAGGAIGSLTDAFTGGNFEAEFKAIGERLGVALGTGNRISLPKLWSESSYRPNLSAVVKLVSPYGHPKAIKEFIIKPLMHLLIMASSRTPDGLSYGQSPKLTIKAYGITYLPLASIQSITLRRGGADTSFNVYRQPLSIDVSIMFESLLDGFAVHTGDFGDISKASVFHDSDDVEQDYRTAKAGERALFPTLDNVISSLRPMAISKLVDRHNKGQLSSSLSRRLAPGDPGRSAHVSTTSPTQIPTRSAADLKNTSDFATLSGAKDTSILEVSGIPDLADYLSGGLEDDILQILKNKADSLKEMQINYKG